MKASKNIEVKAYFLEQLRVFYQLQEKVAMLPAGIRITGALGLLEKIRANEDVGEPSLFVLSATIPTLENMSMDIEDIAKDMTDRL